MTQCVYMQCHVCEGCMLEAITVCKCTTKVCVCYVPITPGAILLNLQYHVELSSEVPKMSSSTGDMFQISITPYITAQQRALEQTMMCAILQASLLVLLLVPPTVLS